MGVHKKLLITLSSSRDLGFKISFELSGMTSTHIFSSNLQKKRTLQIKVCSKILCLALQITSVDSYLCSQCLREEF